MGQPPTLRKINEVVNNNLIKNNRRFLQMKKTLVEMELSEFYSDGDISLVVRPNGVEPKYKGDGALKSEITDGYPSINYNKSMRDDKEALDKAINGGTIVYSSYKQKCTFLEFGLETLEHNDFRFCSMQIKQTVQRWFLNIWDMDGECMVKTYQNIEEALNELHNYINTNEMLPILMNDFIEKLTTNENLGFIAKVTAQPTEKENKNALAEGYKVLQAVEDTDELMYSLISWLGWGCYSSDVEEFLEKFTETLQDDENCEATYNLVDSTFKPRCIEYFRELEKMLEWYDSDYDPRCFTDNSLKVFSDRQLDKLADLAINNLKKSIGSEGRGGYYIKDKNNNLFIADNVILSDDCIKYIEENGYEMFYRDFSSALSSLGYIIDQVLDCQKNVATFNKIKYEMAFTFVLKCINPKKEVK